jgi:hypothetical protein
MFVICIYGLYLTKFSGFNPYVVYVKSLNGIQFDSAYISEYDSGRLFGHISSVFGHPMVFGLFLGLALIYSISRFFRCRNYLYITIIALVVVNFFTCGVRSSIGAIFIVVAYYLIVNRKLKIFICLGAIFACFYLIIMRIPYIKDYLSTIFDFNSSSSQMSGSSAEMRFEQLEGCFKEVSKCPIQGKGYGWTAYYGETYGAHPTILGFESLLFIIICDSGILGFIIWGITIKKWLKNIKQICKDKEIIIFSICLFIFYLSYSCITGEYDYMKYFLIFLTIMIVPENKVRGNIQICK